MDPSLFATIMGGSNDQTPDPNTGLTNADRSQVGFNTIGNIGALLMAAGQPMWGNERARYLAGMGQVGENAQQMKGQLVQQRRVAAQAQREADATKATEAIRGMANDPSAMAGMTPQQQTLAKAAYLSGNPSAVLGIMKEARESQQPIPLGNGMFWDRSSNTAINPITGMQFKLGADGRPTGPAVYTATGNSPNEHDATPNEDGFYDRWLQSAVPQQYHEQIRAIAEGRQKLPSSSGRDGGLNAQIINWARQYNPALDQTTYDMRNKAAKDYAPSGAVGKSIVSLNTFLQHTKDLRDAAAELKNGQVPVWNAVVNAGKSAIGDPAAVRFDQVRGFVTRELDNLISGGRVTIAETHDIREKLNNSQSPEQLQAVLDQMTHLAEARLQSVTQQGQVALGKKGMQSLSEQLGNPKGFAAADYLKNTPLPGTSRAKAAGPGGGFPKPSAADIDYLKSNPGARAKFEKQFGPGSVEAVFQ